MLGINKRQIEIFIVGVLGFALTVYFLPWIEKILAGFIGYAYIPKIISYVVGYLLIVYVWPRVLWKIYNNMGGQI